MYVKSKHMASLFDTTIATITSQIEEQICEVTKVRYEICCIILSGGLSESEYVYACISKKFTSKKIPVIVVPSARNAMVECALQMGINPKGIVGRCSPYTYGFYSIIPFEEGKHPEHLKGCHDGFPTCRAVFFKLIEKGQIVRPGEAFVCKSTTFFRAETNKYAKRFMSMWRSLKKSPEYCIMEEQCEQVALIEIPTSKNGLPDHLNHVQRLIVLGNELKLEFINEDTKEKYIVVVDYVL
ncbi:hypothetical protein DPMN_166332 [Dreissena polymorpha]|uniref:Uncharacterized protein n=1 Tax=Dreissena polymorpha TaxID=45954 RepID=A0A9D4EWN8_DREPO|nr:hypothetical protein DPMN_166332 [Dreissena polymorpha]